MSSGDDDDLDCILEGPVSDELVIVTMTESSQEPGCSQNLLGVLPAPTIDAGSTAELPPCEGRTGELQKGGFCHGPCLSLADALPWPHPCIVSYMENTGILFTYPRKCIPAIIKH